MKNQMSIAHPADFCTVAWAAELCGVSQRTIRRATYPAGDKPPALTRVQPLTGTTESGRRHTLLYADEVRRYADARRLVGMATALP